MDLLGYDITTLGPWAFIAYLFFKEVLPKLFPDVVKLIDKRVSTEDRLFEILEKNAETNQALLTTLDGLTVTLGKMDERMTRIENVLGDTSAQAFMKWFMSLPEAKAARARFTTQEESASLLDDQ